MTATKKPKLQAVPTPRSPGITQRPIRVKRATAQLREQTRRELEISGVAYDASDLEAAAERRLADLLRTEPGVYKQYLKTAPTSISPPRDELFEKVEVAAVRRTAQARELETLFSGAGQPRRRGRPSDRRLTIAVFERNVWDKGRPEVRANVRDFRGSDLLLDWAYGDPFDPDAPGTHERSVLETMQAMLDRHDPNLAIKLNLDAIRELAVEHEDVGRYVAIDGTHVQAWADQGPDYSDEHKKLMNRGMAGAGYGTHGRHFWRGHTLLVLTCLKTTLPLAWIATPANSPEFQAVTPLIDRLYAYWPECPIEYLVGDRGFDVPDTLHQDLEECYGIHLVTPWKRSRDDGGPGDLGTPYCHCTGVGKPMKLAQSDGFVDAAKRRADGIPPGVRIDFKKNKARHRWVCPDCGTSGGGRSFRADPRRHCYLPREGQRAWRVDLRKALLLRRNAAESIFAQIKHRGIAGQGSNAPRWVRTDNHVRWLTGGCLLGLTLRRLAHERGIYAAAHQEALDRRLVKVAGQHDQPSLPLAVAA
jgi:hypothetical protein